MAPIIEVHGLSFTYRDAEEPALRDVSLTVQRGELVVVMGASGSGKTTLAKCLNRTIPTFQPGLLEGEIVIAGRRQEGQTVADLAGVVGLVSQDFEAQLFSTNVAQEVAFGMEQMGVEPGAMAARVAKALALVGLAGFERRDPATLSGGEKQRVAIASVLALQPQVLIFDEPTTDLDPEGKVQIFDVLATLRRAGATILLIEHEITAAERADRLVLLSGGTIVADDEPPRLLGNVQWLEDLGIRPADLDRLAISLGTGRRFRSVEDAAAVFRPRASRSTPAVEPPCSAAEPILEAEALGHVYEGGREALRDVSFRVRRGELIALIGQNGSGKTTLAKHLNGLLQPSSGRVCLQGVELRGLALDQIARRVGYVFQDPDHQIFAPTVRDEVSFGLRNSGLPEEEVERQARRVLDEVGLVGLDDADPFLLGKGHRQQLAVASILALRPEVLILDEPTTGLDYREQRRIMTLLRSLHVQGLTLIVITHSPWVVAEYARRAVVLDKGHIAFDGALRELFARAELLERCHFTVPDITRVGLHCGVSALTCQELLAALEPSVPAIDRVRQA